MKTNKFIDVENLQSAFQYDPETGRIWRKLKTGLKETGFSKSNGYLNVKFKKHLYLVHRISWGIYYGTTPEHPIDHINGNPLDNRLCNLRLTTDLTNQYNRKKNRNSKSGIKGVTWHLSGMAWRAQIRINGKKVHLGSFSTKEQAGKAYESAAKKLHGEFYKEQAA